MLTVINKFRIRIFSLTTLWFLRICFLIVAMVIYYLITKFSGDGGFYSQGNFITSDEGAYKLKIFQLYVGEVGMLWLGTFGLKYKKA